MKNKVPTFNQYLIEQKLYEIGDSNLKPYNYKKPKKKFDNLIKSKDIDIKFKTESGLNYVVSIKPLYYFLIIDFWIDDKNNMYPETNKGELFKVMATVVSIVKDFIKLNPEIKGLRYDPKSKQLNNDLGKQRDNLYKAFIKKQIDNVEFTQSGATTFVIFKNKK